MRHHVLYFLITLNLECGLDEATIHKNTKKFISHNLYVTCKSSKNKKKASVFIEQKTVTSKQKWIKLKLELKK